MYCFMLRFDCLISYAIHFIQIGNLNFKLISNFISIILHQAWTKHISYKNINVSDVQCLFQNLPTSITWSATSATWSTDWPSSDSSTWRGSIGGMQNRTSGPMQHHKKVKTLFRKLVKADPKSNLKKVWTTAKLPLGWCNNWASFTPWVLLFSVRCQFHQHVMTSLICSEVFCT